MFGCIYLESKYNKKEYPFKFSLNLLVRRLMFIPKHLEKSYSLNWIYTQFKS